MSTVPDAPSPVRFSSLTGTSVVVSFTDGANNGAAIDTRQITYGTDPSGGQFFVTSDRSTLIGNLAPGTRWFFWARTHNANGWSLWSSRRDITTYDYPDAPDPVILSNITQNSLTAKFSGNWNGGTQTLEYQLSYGTDPNGAQISVTSTGTTNLTNLKAGEKYYFWARARNSVGWSHYSAVRSATLLAGAFVKVGTVWKRAVPYVRVAGVWKVAEAWGKSAGYWDKGL